MQSVPVLVYSNRKIERDDLKLVEERLRHVNCETEGERQMEKEDVIHGKKKGADMESTEESE